MKIITWNVNGVRTRLPRVQALLARHRPDALCLQETKTPDDKFPHEAINEAGYEAAISGQKSYNGVAILTPRGAPAAGALAGFDGDPIPEQARVISAEVGGVQLVNVYVVNGKSLDSEAYPLKLKWLDALAAWLADRHDPAAPLVVCGDFNIAPDERDVYDPEVWKDRVLVSEPERQRLAGMLAWGLTDLHRLHSDEGGVFSWWDYRFGAFPRGMGLRIDLMLGSAPVAARCAGVEVDRQERKKTTGEGNPSDHAPVICHLE